MTNLRYTWYDTVSAIPAEKWNTVFEGHSILKKHAFTVAVAQSGLTGVQQHYLVISSADAVHAIISCFSYRVKLEILAGDSIKGIANAIRRVFPSFLYTRLFVIGSPVATCENHIAVNRSLYPEGLLPPAVCAAITSTVIRQSKSTKAALILIKEIPAHELPQVQRLFGNTFTCFQSLPNSFIPLFPAKWPYPAMLRKRYRQRVRTAMREVDMQGYTWSFVQNFGPLCATMHQLYTQVLDKSPYKFETLTPAFFEQVNQQLPDSSFALVCKNSQADIVCAELVIDDGNTLIPMYLGLDYSKTEESKVYYNVIFQTLLEAEKRNKQWLILGQTSYAPKAYSGALFEKLYIGVHAHGGFMRFLVRTVFKYLFPAFKKPVAHSIQPEVMKQEQFQQQLANSSRVFEPDV